MSKQICRDYQIIMRTSLGLRHGTMCCRIVGESLEGTISLMGHTQSFHGAVTADGSCRIEGELGTLMRVIPYQGMGKIQKEKLHLVIQGDKCRSYTIEGTSFGLEESV